jgi:ATP-dependent helicase/nuclease subunit A
MSVPSAKQASPEQRDAADPAACVWVSANAGTGKTHVLIDRVTRLLLEGADPGRILCVTFTKAAAAEMEGRLFRRLGEWATHSDAKLHEELQALQPGIFDADALRRARKLFASALETPGGLKIRTIHAFCESLLRRFPLEAGVARHFEVLDDRTAFELRAQARTRVLANAQTGADPVLSGALEQLVRLIDEAEFIRLTDEALRQQRHGDDESLEALQAALFRWLGVPGLQQSDDIIAAFAHELPTDDLRRAAAALQNGSTNDQTRASQILEYLICPDVVAGFKTYQLIFLTKENEFRKNLITKPAQKNDAQAWPILEREQQRVFALALALRAQKVALSSLVALRTGAAVRNAYQNAKRARAALDYDDLIDHTRHVLKSSGAAWVHYKLDGGLDHILVDEAQDTSPEQWEIIRSLSDEFFSGRDARTEAREQQGKGPRTLFAVGDEKQSIFSFQGADPASFAAMRKVFSARAQESGLLWRDISLLTSFRSTEQVLEAVDAVFANPDARKGLSADDAVVRHIASRTGQPGRVEIWPAIEHEATDAPLPWDAPVDAAPRSSPRAQMAARVAGHIAGVLRDAPVMPSTGKPARPDDIIVLVRTRNEFFDECIRQLKLRNIAVAGADRMQLLDQLAVMDLIAAGNFVLMPEDDLTLATVLRSPFIGLSEEQLFDLAHDRKDQTLWDALRARRGVCEAFEDATVILTDLLARADTVPPYEFFARLLGPLRGRRKLLARLGADANDPIDEFLALAQQFERAHPPGLQGFLHWLGASQTQIKRDLEQGAGAVRVMTVHGAKGLEAPIVYLPDTCSMPDGKLAPKLIPVADENFLVWPVRKENDDPETAAMRERAVLAQVYEYRRLLYVAMTRAKDWLFIGGYRGRNKLPDGCWYTLIETALRPLAEPVALPWGQDGLRIFRAGDPDVQSPTTTISQRTLALPDWAHRPAPPEPTPQRPLAPSRLGVDDTLARSPRYSATPQDRFRRGRLIHLLLQYLPDIAEARRAAAARRYLSQKNFALSEPAIEDIVAQAMTVLAFPDFAPVFGPGSRAEVSIAGLVPAMGRGAAISGQIDRLLVTGQEILVVDYKTHRAAPISPDDVPKIYVQQMAAYRAALRMIYPNHRVRCALIWTDIPLLMPLAEAQLDDATVTS